MAKKNSSEQVYDFQRMLVAALSFDGEECYCEPETDEQSLDALHEEYADCNDAIFTYQMLLDGAILRNDEDEISSLRRSIQSTKVTKRRIKEKMDAITKNTKELVGA